MEFIPYLVRNETAFALVLIRVAAFVAVLPLMGGLGVPPLLKVGLVLAIALVLFPMIGVVPQPLEVFPVASGMLGEALIGLIVGLGFRFLFAAVDIASEIEGLQMGFGIGNVFNPTLGQETSLIGQLRGLVAILIFLAVNAHHVVFEALMHSFRRIPSLSFMPSPALLDHLVRLSGEMFALGVKIAIPVTLVLILTNLAFGILSRVVPQMNILLFSFPVTTAMGLFVVGASLSLFAALMRDQMGNLSGVTFELLEGMVQR